MQTTVISAALLNQYLEDPRWILVDCRYDLSDTNAGYRAYLDGHIPRAVYADLKHDLSGPPVTDHGRHPLPTPERLINLFSFLGISSDHQVLVYDSSYGSVAARLWWLLRYMGHTGVCVLEGGWQAWLKAGYATEQSERRNAPAMFQGKPQQDYLVNMNAVMAAQRLIDARDPVRFLGEQEPLDPIAGHIPGAINHYWKNNLDADGGFLPAARLKQLYLDIYENVPPAEVVFYCGSGVTACHDILAAVHAGLPTPRLYAGSWSEWCGDGARPIATGPA